MWNVKCEKRVEHWVHVYMCLGMCTNPFRCNAMYLFGACEFLIFTVGYEVYALHPAIVLYTATIQILCAIPYFKSFCTCFCYNLKLRLCCIFPHNHFRSRSTPFPFFICTVSRSLCRPCMKYKCNPMKRNNNMFSILFWKCVVVAATHTKFKFPFRSNGSGKAVCPENWLSPIWNYERFCLRPFNK